MTKRIYTRGNLSLPIQALFGFRWLRRHLYVSAPLMAAVSVAGLALQWYMSQYYEGAPFLTLYPAVVLTSLCASVFLGLGIAIIDGALQWALFIPHAFPLAVGTYALDVVLCLGVCDFVNRSFDGLLTIIEQEQASGRQHYLRAQELHHRLQNMFAVIQAVIRLSLTDRRLVDPLKVRDQLIGRIQAMSTASVLISESEQNGVPLAQLVAPELAAAHGRIAAHLTLGVILGGQLAQNLSLILHELVTNALKHGALSVEAGRVVLNIDCEAAKPGKSGKLTLSWHEHNGPLVVQPAATGFGTQLLGRFARSIGTVVMEYKPLGFNYSLKARSDDIWFADNVVKLPARQQAA